MNVTATVVPEADYDADAVCQAVRSRIQSYFCGERLGKRVKRVDIYELIHSTEGVANYTLSLPTADVPIDADMLPKLGTLRVSKGA